MTELEKRQRLRAIDPSFQLTEKQKIGLEILRTGAPYICFVGGARSGKTFEFVMHIVQRALDAAGSRHLICRYRFNACVQSIWRDTLPAVMQKCFPEAAKVATWNSADHFLKFANGSEIWMGGLDEKDRLEKILGLEFATIFVNEVSQVVYASIVIVRTRLAQKVLRFDGTVLILQLLVDLNPTGSAHWTHKMFIERIDPESYQPLASPDDYKFLFWTPYDNRDNLPQGYIEKNLENLPPRQRKRFVEGVYVAEVEGALWTIEALERLRIEPLAGRDYRDDPRVPVLSRIVVGVDPSGTKGDEDQRSNEVGIIVMGVGHDPIDGKLHGYVLADLTCNLPPEKWARVVVSAYESYLADVVVAEINYGGDMVRATIHAVSRAVKVRVVTASRGKAIRAEPVSTLYDQGLIHHVGPRDRYMRLEDQLLNFSTAGYLGSKSPDRGDAMVWSATELMVKRPKAGARPAPPVALPIYAR